ncbi:MAG: hypothetical protein IH627_09900 [Rubrivivax sp.]|nr:hypothetical protein [Rubrivivax sp.]
MNTRNTASRQATAFGFAALVTLSLLAGVDRLATQAGVETQIAHQAAPTQVVVIAAKRDART